MVYEDNLGSGEDSDGAKGYCNFIVKKKFYGSFLHLKGLKFNVLILKD
jgi:hypothetical protein